MLSLNPVQDRYHTTLNLSLHEVNPPLLLHDDTELGEPARHQLGLWGEGQGGRGGGLLRPQGRPNGRGLHQVQGVWSLLRPLVFNRGGGFHPPPSGLEKSVEVN